MLNTGKRCRSRSFGIACSSFPKTIDGTSALASIACNQKATECFGNLGDELAPVSGHQDKGMTPFWR
jgi:hypothetical protein